MFPFFRQSGFSIVNNLGLSLLLISEAFFGFEILSYVANEAREPKKLHKVLFAGIFICGIIVIVYVLSSFGIVSYHKYVTDARPFAVQAFNTMGDIGRNIVVFGMYLVIIGAAASWPITGSRLIHAMSKDKLFIEQFKVLHPKHNSPHRAVIFQTIMTLLFSFLVFRGDLVNWGDSYRTFYLMYIMLSLVAILLIVFTVPILRKKEKDLERPFKAPLPLIGPLLFLIFFVVLVVNWYFIEGGIATSIILMSFSFIFLALPFYFLVEMFYDKDAIVKVNDSLSYFNYFFDNISFPFSIGKKIAHRFGILEGKKILQFGCSTGNLTKEFGEMVGDHGKVYAVDIAKHKVEFTKKRVLGLNNISVYRNDSLEEFNFVPDEKVDIFYSVGLLSYFQNPTKMLSDINTTLKEDGKIIFIDYDKFFYFIPNLKWIEDDQMLINIFEKAGFKILIERKNSLLWQHIIIKGIKI